LADPGDLFYVIFDRIKVGFAAVTRQGYRLDEAIYGMARPGAF